MAKSELYDDGPENNPQDQDQDSDQDTGKGGGDTDQDSGQDESSAQAVIPKALLAGKDFKPGDEIVLKIDSIHGDEVVVSYAPEKGSQGSEEGQGEGEGEGQMGQGAPEGAPAGGAPGYSSMMD